MMLQPPKIHSTLLKPSRSLELLVSLTLLSWSVLSSEALARLARIHSVDGTVHLKRADWSEFTSVPAGSALYGDDLLKPDPNSTVVITCPNGERSDNPPPPGLESSVNRSCPGTPRSNVRPDFGVSEVWGGSDPTIPFVLTPRSDFILRATPTLWWYPISGATTYTVTLTIPQGDVWQLTTEQTTLPYPEDEPQLMADGTLYELVVTADTGTASTDEGLDLKFIRTLGADVSEAEAEIAEVQAMDLPDDIRTLVLVEEVYPKYGLTGEAIADLLALIENCTGTAHIYRLLGELYVKSGLQIPAEESFRTALELAAAQDNLEEETLAYLGLSTLYQGVNEPEKMVESLRQAKAGATALGDIEMIISIDSQLSRL